MSLHKVFISYHHRNDQFYKEELLRLNRLYPMFIDVSVDTGDIPNDLDDQATRQIIRDDYLRDSTVTIVLVGVETQCRKHIDWEIYSSMFNGKKNKQSGVLVVNLPSTNCSSYYAAHEEEKEIIYPENSSWVSIDTRKECEEMYPYHPERVIDNLLEPDVYISVVNWDKIVNNLHNLQFLIDATFNDRLKCNYNLRRNMRRKDS